VEAFEDILEEVLTLKEGDVWLFPTVWISDALALGKYHTGSNICAWKAFDGMARLMGEVFEDQEKQKKYGEIASEIKKAIEVWPPVLRGDRRTDS
jgi:GH15 family glucan-1,4-alpha-glucosidase